MSRPLHLLAVLFAIAASARFLACDSADDTNTRHNQPVFDPTADGGASGPKCTEVGKTYVGFAGTKLEEGRINAAAGTDRARIKPYSALRGEYEKAIGAAPGSLEQSAGSFGAPPERFASEPRASAIQVFSAFRVGFDGCLTFTETAPEFAAAPTQDSATAQCTTMARKFWSRAPTADEVKSCTQVALVDSAAEGDPRRRWAYTCATLLSSAGFLTY
jgi:hypothetical protein